VKRGELIAALNQVVSQLTDIVTALEEWNQPPASSDAGKCPIHNVPWKKYKWGWSHPPAKAGEKWCNKDTFDH